jgi:hypothetical protein
MAELCEASALSANSRSISLLRLARSRSITWSRCPLMGGGKYDEANLALTHDSLAPHAHWIRPTAETSPALMVRRAILPMRSARGGLGWSSLSRGPRNDSFDQHRAVAAKDESLPRYVVNLRPSFGTVVPFWRVSVDQSGHSRKVMKCATTGQGCAIGAPSERPRASPRFRSWIYHHVRRHRGFPASARVVFVECDLLLLSNNLLVAGRLPHAGRHHSSRPDGPLGFHHAG